MVTAIISLSKVHGAEMWLIGWIVCMCAYFTIMLLIKDNRKHKKAIKNTFFWFLVGEFIADLTWALIYYNNSGYINYGVGAICGLFIWPIVLIVAGILATIENKKK